MPIDNLPSFNDANQLEKDQRAKLLRKLAKALDVARTASSTGKRSRS